MAKINEIDITSLTFQEGSAPATPASTKWKIYTKTDGLYVIDDAGTETGPLGSGGGGGGAWTSYTPTWTGASSNPAIGNGTLQGYYEQVGKTVHGWVNMTAGSTTTFGSGSWYMAAPVAAFASYPTFMHVGGGYFEDSGTGNGTFVVVLDRANQRFLFIEDKQTSGGRVYTSAIPMTWTTSDYLRFSFTYQAA